jgi:hypothetical protein
MAAETDQDAATEAEVHAAIEALPASALQRLDRYARARVRLIGSKSGGRDHQVLFQEAVLAVLEGRRSWKPKVVSIDNLVAGAIRSISSHWAEGYDPDEAVAESQLATTDAGLGVLSTVASSTPSVERALVAKEELGELLRAFKDDDHVTLVIEGFREDMSGPEIKAGLGLTESEYGAARKKLLRYRDQQRKGTRRG